MATVRQLPPRSDQPAVPAPPPEPAASEAPVDPVRAIMDEALKSRPPGPPQAPVIKVTRYEQVSTFLLALIIAVALGVTSLTMTYLASRPRAPEAVAPLEMIELPGGAEDGSIEETLKVESPYEERPDASIDDARMDDQSTIEETIEDVIEVSETATQLTQQQFLLDAQNTGRKGSATGTGRRALGSGPGKSGLPRDQRWFVNFSDRTAVTEYARQLDHFGIELGAVFPDRIVFLSNMSTQPKTRTVNTGKGENRLYMSWQGGNRRQADQELFQKAGIDATNALILHFYPPATEATLARLEREHSKVPVDRIRRTYYNVNSVKNGYEFVVTKQAYFQ